MTDYTSCSQLNFGGFLAIWNHSAIEQPHFSISFQPLIWWRPIEDLDWQGGDFRRHNKMIVRSATRKGYRKIIHSLICQSLFKHAIVSMMKLAVYMYTKIEIREIDGSYLSIPARVWQIFNIKGMRWPETEILGICCISKNYPLPNLSISFQTCHRIDDEISSIYAGILK